MQSYEWESTLRIFHDEKTIQLFDISMINVMKYLSTCNLASDEIHKEN